MATYDSTYPELRTLPKMIAFLEGKLSAAEEAQIEKIIEEDDLYAYALERLDQAMLKGENLESVAGQFQEVFIDTIRTQAKTPKTIFPYWARYMVAAVVLIGFVALIFFPRNVKDISDLEIQPYETRLGLKGGGNIENLNAFILAYQNQDYTNTIEIGNQLLGTVEGLSESQVNEIYLCLGNSYLQLEDRTAAIDILERALQAPESRVRTEARWYLAMTFLKKEDIDLARQYLQEIKAPEAGKARIEEAEKLLEDLP